MYIYMVGRAGSIPFLLYSILLALNSLPKINSLNKQTWIFNSALDQTKLSKVPMEIGHGHLCFEIVNTVPYRKKLNTCVNFILYLSQNRSQIVQSYIKEISRQWSSAFMQILKMGKSRIYLFRFSTNLSTLMQAVTHKR